YLLFTRPHFLCLRSTASSSSVIYTPSLHDALPISSCPFFAVKMVAPHISRRVCATSRLSASSSTTKTHQFFSKSSEVENDIMLEDRKSTRLNSSHGSISYAVFCLKKKRFNA